jgi:hypothetical protein
LSQWDKLVKYSSFLASDRQEPMILKGKVTRIMTLMVPICTGPRREKVALWHPQYGLLAFTKMIEMENTFSSGN